MPSKKSQKPSKTTKKSSVADEPDLGEWLGPSALQMIEDELKQKQKQEWEFSQRRDATRISRSLMGM